MNGWRFSSFKGKQEFESAFDLLFKLFKDLIMHTNRDVEEALAWLTELDKTYELTDENYTLEDFIQDLIDKGFLIEKRGVGNYEADPSLDTSIRQQALDEVFGKMKPTQKGNHNTSKTGVGEDRSSDIKPFEFGDSIHQIAISESIRNAQINHGLGDFKLTQDDLSTYETYQQSRSSSVLMIDISHSMILYGEDRITPAKKVALALAEYIRRKYPKDTLDIIVFGDTAWKIELKDIPYLQVGPYHTNTVAGLELAREILRRRKNPNKQVFMITDGKPTCIQKGKKFYKNPYGLDRQIVSRTLTLASQFRKQNIPITTFMIASDPYLQEFVDNFTEVNQGKAFYSSLDNLGEFVLRDYKENKTKRY